MRLLLRESARQDSDTMAALDGILSRGAAIVVGDVGMWVTRHAMPLKVTHVLNRAFMDMMPDPRTAGIVDLGSGSARLWGTGDEPFNLTTVDDRARSTARLATDPDDVSGSRTTFNEIIAESERLSGKSLTTTVLGSACDLRRIMAEADDPWSVIMQWYFLSMITVRPFAGTGNDRYPGLRLTTLHDYLAAAHRALQHS